MTSPAERAGRVKASARALVFDAVGIADLAPVAHAGALERWLARGMAGTMTYMHRQAGRRNAPATILPGTTRAVVVTRHYAAEEPTVPAGAARIARYARGTDYHERLRPALAALADAVCALGDAHTVARWYLDAGPVPERELAQRAGLGWIGKNTMLIDPARGSYSFIAAVLTNLDLAVDPPFEADRCGDCVRCLEACPTGAFPEPRVLDARRCISYLTIEHRGPMPDALAGATGDWLFGCDVCQEVCPWNVKFAAAVAEPLEADPTLAWADADAIADMTDDAFAARFGTTALTRAGPDGLRRNARAVAANRAGD